MLHLLFVRLQEMLEVEDLSGLAEAVAAFVRSKDTQAAQRCVRVFVRHRSDGAPVIVFGWAPS
jgi:hypothetical protein